MWAMTAAPLVAGVAFSVLGGVVRMRAWHAALADAAPTVRYRDIVVAHLGGAGFNGIIPAHGGDAVKLALLKRRGPGGRLRGPPRRPGPPAPRPGPLPPPVPGGGAGGGGGRRPAPPAGPPP